MNIQLNEKSVREMADRMRQAIGADTLSHSKALESVSRTFGFPNWDTLSGMLKREIADSAPKEPAFKLDQSVTLYMSAYSDDEWGTSPGWLKLTVDQRFVDTVLELRELANEQKLAQASVSWDADTWGGDDDLRVECGTLEVNGWDFWLEGLPRHGDHSVLSRALGINVLLAALKSRKSNDYLVCKDDFLLYDPSGNTNGLLEMLVDEEVLDESVLG